MPNDITVLPEKESIIITNIDGTQDSYCLTENPPVGSSVVQYAKKEILQNLDLHSVLSNIDNAAGLMHVAYNALAGTKIQSKMQGLQKELLDLTDHSIVSVQSFKSKAEQLAVIIRTTYKYLTKCQEQLAIAQLLRCSAAAKAMAEESEKLAGKFSILANKTEAVLEETMDEQAIQHQKIEQIREEIAKFEAQQASSLVQQEETQKMIEDLDSKYTEETERLKKLEDEEASNRKVGMAMQIVSAVLSPVTSILSSVTSSFGNKENLEQQKQQAMDETQKQIDAVQADAQKNAEKNTEISDEIKALEEAIQTLKSDISAKQATLEKTETEQEKQTITAEVEAAQNALSEKEANLAKLKKEKETLMENQNTYTEKTKELTDAFAKIGERFDQAAAESKTAADAARKQREEIFKQKLDMEKENRKLLANLAEFAKTIESSKISKDTAKSAVETLQVAIQCLKQIVTALATGALFWRSMEQYCTNLAEGELVQNIKDIQQLQQEDRLEIYHDRDFMIGILNYMGKWVALYSVCSDYLNAANNVRGVITNNINEAPSIEAAKEAAPQLAAKMLQNVQQQMDGIDERCKMLESNIA